MNKRDFEHAYARGRRARRDGLTVWVAPSSGSGPARLGIAIHARTGNAVTRNRMRRRIRHAFRAVRVPEGTNVVVRGDASVASRNFQEVRSDLRAALAEAAVRTER